MILPLFWGLTLATPGQALLRRLLLGTLLLPVAFIMVLLYAQFQLALYRTHLPALTETPPADYILALLGVLLLLGCDPQQRQYRVAMQQLFHHDYRAATLTLGSLAENGHAPAQFRLGMLYRLGLGVPRNPRRAVYWFEKAARGDGIGGQYWLAESFRRGEGVPVSPELAFEWFHRLAERGYAPAQYQVALAYAGLSARRTGLAARSGASRGLGAENPAGAVLIFRAFFRQRRRWRKPEL